jgi:hypothetical protein
MEELAEWADALEANAQDMREGFEASEPDIRNAAFAIRAHRCQPSAATAGSGVAVNPDALVQRLRETRDMLAAYDVGGDELITLSTNTIGMAVVDLDGALAEIERQRGAPASAADIAASRAAMEAEDDGAWTDLDDPQAN